MEMMFFISLMIIPLTLGGFLHFRQTCSESMSEGAAVRQGGPGSKKTASPKPVTCCDVTAARSMALSFPWDEQTYPCSKHAEGI